MSRHHEMQMPNWLGWRARRAGTVLAGLALVMGAAAGKTWGAESLRSSPRPRILGDESWWDGFGPPGTASDRIEGWLSGFAVVDDHLIAAGYILRAGGIHVDNIVRWDGASWQPYGNGTSLPIDALVVYNGQLVASSFSLPGHVARWDGEQWLGLAQGLGGPPQFLGVYGGNLIAGVGSIFSWNGSSWTQLGSRFNNSTLRMAVWRGDLLVSGYFTMAGEVPVQGLARWNGSQWSAVAPPVSVSVSGGGAYIYDLAAHDGDLIAVGDFTRAGEVAANCIARWDGVAWHPLGSGLNNSAHQIETIGGDLFVSGEFTAAGGIPAARLARWDGSRWHAMGLRGGEGSEAVTPSGGIMGAYGDTLLVFPPWYGYGYGRVAMWSRDSSWRWLARPSPTGAGVNGHVHALIPYGTDVVAAGDFFDAGNVLALNVARWDGATWHALGTGLNGAVHALADYGGLLVAAGDFTYAGDLPVQRVAAWDGNAWLPLGEGMNRSVLALAVHDLDLVAGGEFSSAGGLGASRAARWDGRAWHPLGDGFNSTVEALTVHGGEFFAAGSFVASGGVALNRIARWDGSVWRPVGQGLDTSVHALASYDGSLFAGGAFRSTGGVPTDFVARWDGQAWTPLGAGVDGPVLSLAGYLGGLYAGGRFSRSGSSTTYCIARWDGVAWNPLGTGTNGGVSALAGQAGHMFAAGEFILAGDKRSHHIARWDDVPSALSIARFAPSRQARSAHAVSTPAPVATTVLYPLVEPADGGPLRIGYRTSAASRVLVTLYDVRGRPLRVLENRVRPAGEHVITWDRRDEAGQRIVRGIYFVHLQAGTARTTCKIPLLRD